MKEGIHDAQERIRNCCHKAEDIEMRTFVRKWKMVLNYRGLQKGILNGKVKPSLFNLTQLASADAAEIQVHCFKILNSSNF